MGTTVSVLYRQGGFLSGGGEGGGTEGAMIQTMGILGLWARWLI